MKKSSWILLLVLGVLAMAGCSKKGPMAHEKFVYNAVGASDTLGVGAFPIASGYTFRIQDDLKDQGRDVALFHVGIPAANTDLIANAVLRAADQGLTSELATVWVGANDLINGVPVQTFASSLDTLLSSLQDDMEAFVILANLPSLPNLPSFLEEPLPEVTTARVDDYNAVIRSQARARNIPVVNLAGDAIDGHLVYDFDGFHPDDEGHERLGKLFMNVIRPLL